MRHRRALATMLSAVVASLLVLPAGGRVEQAAAASTESPPPLYEPVMAYDAATSQLIMFGGGGSAMNADTWSWEGGGWRQLHPRHSPPPRQGAAMAYDPASRQLLLFGGSVMEGGDESKPLFYGGRNHEAVRSDTWAWDGSDWTLLQQSLPDFGWSPNPMMAFDAADHRMAIDQLCSNCGAMLYTRLWWWDSGRRTWTLTASTPPAAPGVKSMPLDSDGNHEWVPVALDSRRPVFHAGDPGQPSRAIAGDPSTGGVLYVGQETASGLPGTAPAETETWTWRAGHWEQLTVREHPGALLPTPLLSGTGGSELLLFDGLGETWLWDGVSWSRQAGASPGMRAGAAMAYDAVSGQVLLYGGEGSAPGGLYADTWAWGGGGWRRIAGPRGPQAVPNAWSRPDPPTSLVPMAREDVIASRDLGTRSAVVRVEVKLVRNRDLPPGWLSPIVETDGQDGRLTWLIAYFCDNTRSPGAPCSIEGTVGGGSPPPSVRWMVEQFDALAPDEGNGLSAGGNQAAPPFWAGLPDLSATSAPTAEIAAVVVIPALVGGCAVLLLLRRRRHRRRRTATIP